MNPAIAQSEKKYRVSPDEPDEKFSDLLQRIDLKKFPYFTEGDLLAFLCEHFSTQSEFETEALKRFMNEKRRIRRQKDIA